VTAVTPAEAEAWHAARAVDTEASMRLSRNCRSGQALSTGLPAPSCPPHDRLHGGAGRPFESSLSGCPEGLLLFGWLQRDRIILVIARSVPGKRLEHPHRPTLEDHVHRATRLGRSRSLNLRIGISPFCRQIPRVSGSILPSSLAGVRVKKTLTSLTDSRGTFR
jgi:hypothetical protein